MEKPITETESVSDSKTDSQSDKRRSNFTGALRYFTMSVDDVKVTFTQTTFVRDCMLKQRVNWTTIYV